MDTFVGVLELIVGAVATVPTVVIVGVGETLATGIEVNRQIGNSLGHPLANTIQPYEPGTIWSQGMRALGGIFSDGWQRITR